MINPEELESNQEFEQKVRSSFQIQDPDQLFVNRLGKRLTDRFIERSSESKPSHRKDKFKIMFSPLAWGTIAVILILALIWSIKTLIPNFEPARNFQPSPAVSPTPLSVSTQATTPLTGAKVAITSENASQLVELAHLGRGSVSGITWSPDGRTFAIGSSSGIYLYNAETFEEVSTLAGGPRVNNFIYSPDGKTIAVASSTGIHLYDAETYDEASTIAEGTEIDNIIYSPDGAVLVGGDVDNITMWDVTSGTLLFTIPERVTGYSSYHFSPDSTLLAFGYDDSTINIWDMSSEKVTHAITESYASFGPFIFSNDGARLIALSRPGPRALKIWDVVSGTPLRTLVDCSGYDMRLSPDDRTIAVLQDDGILFCDVETGLVINKLDVIGDYYMEFSPDGTILADGVNNSIKLWDVATMEEVSALPEQEEGVEIIAFSPDGKRLAAASSNSVKIWDIASGQELHTLTGDTPIGDGGLGKLDGYYDEVTNVTFSPDGKLLAAGHSGRLNLYDLDTSGVVTELDMPTIRYGEIAFSPDGKLIAGSAWYDGKPEVEIWDVATQELRLKLENLKDPVLSLAFSPDSSMLVTGSGGGYGAAYERPLKIWNVSTGELLIEYGKQLGDSTLFTTIFDLAFMPNSTILGAVDSHGSVLFWDIIQQNEVRSIPGSGSMGLSIAFSPDGSLMAIGGVDNTPSVRVWDLRTEEVLFTLGGYTSNVWGVEFSPNGQILASSTDGAPVQLWEMETGKSLVTLDAPFAVRLAFSPDGTLLATGGDTVRLWGIAPANDPQP